jgi:hypothetical protein
MQHLSTGRNSEAIYPVRSLKNNISLYLYSLGAAIAKETVLLISLNLPIF